MKKVIWMYAIMITVVFAANAETGKALYLEADCQKCHRQGETFDPNSINKAGRISKVKDIQGIHKWVEGCDSYFSIGWFPEEQNRVSVYLNATHYHLKK